ncbi:dephospho-CoA kinase [Lactiplantibacillus plantarum]|nr:dephospho-CoA kinase [Lactiplantibacillus plantarum]
MTKLIGLTGGIATGKSTVSKLLATKLPIVDADKIAWQVEGPGQPTTQKLWRTLVSKQCWQTGG